MVCEQSADLGYHTPFAIAGYALLTHMIAHLTGYQTGELIVTLGDYHVFKDHYNLLMQQLLRTPRKFPRLRINRERIGSIEEFKPDDFTLIDYHPHTPLHFSLIE